MKRQLLTRSAIVVLVVVLSPALAQAQNTNIYIPQSATVFIGLWNGVASVVWQTSNECFGQTISSNSSPDSHTWLFATNSNERFYVVDREVQACNGRFIVRPFVGSVSLYSINVVAGGGDDIVANLNPNVVAFRAYGGPGADKIVSRSQNPNYFIAGGTGNDTLWGGTNAVMYGEDDYDTLCIDPGTVAAYVSGGGHIDTACGYAQAGEGIEGVVCPCPSAPTLLGP